MIGGSFSRADLQLRRQGNPLHSRSNVLNFGSPGYGGEIDGARSNLSGVSMLGPWSLWGHTVEPRNDRAERERPEPAER